MVASAKSVFEPACPWITRTDLVHRVEDERVAPCRDGGPKGAEGEAVARFEEVRVAGEDPELRKWEISTRFSDGCHGEANVDEAKKVNGVATVQVKLGSEIGRAHV